MTKNICRIINIGLLCFYTSVIAQTKPTPEGTSKQNLAYSVVSIHLIAPGQPYSLGTTPLDETVQIGTLKNLIGYAYDIRPEFVSGGPNWSDSQLFKIAARVDESDIQVFKDLSYEQKAPMMQLVLESRFGLKVHTEVKVLRVFDLVLAKGGLGPKFTIHSPANPAYQLGYTSDSFAGYGIEMPLFTKALSSALRATVGRPIIDKTGLTGKYDFDLRWSAGLSANPSAGQATAGTHPDFFTDLQEQFGFKLQPAQEPVETIVIDSANQPSEN